MTLFQLILLLVAGGIFYLFFRQLFSGNYPKRGVDFEASVPDDRIGGLMQPDKTFAKAPTGHDRIAELIAAADEALEKGDNLEAKKALQSAQILAPDNPDVLRRLGVVYLNMHDPASAKEVYAHLLKIDPQDDLAEGSLANALHQLGEDAAALEHHQRAIELDGTYAPHYFNYANTLYDMGDRDGALAAYQKAYALDSTLEAARKMIEELTV
jgi:tetratricopeptide (TPR) repeat protein